MLPSPYAPLTVSPAQLRAPPRMPAPPRAAPWDPSAAGEQDPAACRTRRCHPPLSDPRLGGQRPVDAPTARPRPPHHRVTAREPLIWAACYVGGDGVLKLGMCAARGLAPRDEVYIRPDVSQIEPGRYLLSKELTLSSAPPSPLLNQSKIRESATVQSEVRARRKPTSQRETLSPLRAAERPQSCCGRF